MTNPGVITCGCISPDTVVVVVGGGGVDLCPQVGPEARVYGVGPGRSMSQRRWTPRTQTTMKLRYTADNKRLRQVNLRGASEDDAVFSTTTTSKREMLKRVTLSSLQENCVYETVVPPLDERDFGKTVTPIVQEYFEHGDTNEVAVSAPNPPTHRCPDALCTPGCQRQHFINHEAVTLSRLSVVMGGASCGRLVHS